MLTQHIVTSEPECLAMYGELPKAVFGPSSLGIEGSDALGQLFRGSVIAHVLFELGDLTPDIVELLE
jgi:hypothetical protein